MTEVTLDEIKYARDKCARIIVLYGDRYLPIFERLEKEIDVYSKRQELLLKAVKIGTLNGTQNGTPSIIIK